VTVSPLPRDGAILAGRDRRGRTLRIARHSESERVVLSVWQDATCVATVRLAPDDVAALIGDLAQLLTPPATAATEEHLAG
jgi:hypothetical protein